VVVCFLEFEQHEGRPDLILADVPRITNYWMEITGASEWAARGVTGWLRSGQGRWRLNDREPSQVVRKYIQSALEEKLSTSDFGAAIKKQLCQWAFSGPTGLCKYIDFLSPTYEYWGGSSGTGGGLALRRILLLRFALLSKLVGPASVVCVWVSTVHRNSR
jgi:hypothetical protein